MKLLGSSVCIFCVQKHQNPVIKTPNYQYFRFTSSEEKLNFIVELLSKVFKRDLLTLSYRRWKIAGWSGGEGREGGVGDRYSPIFHLHQLRLLKTSSISVLFFVRGQSSVLVYYCDSFQLYCWMTVVTGVGNKFIYCMFYFLFCRPIVIFFFLYVIYH